MKKKFVFCFVVFLICSLVSAEAKRKVTVDDYFKLKGISDIQISPDGKYIANISNSEPINYINFPVYVYFLSREALLSA